MKSSFLSRASAGYVAGFVGLLATAVFVSSTPSLSYAAKGGNGDSGGANENNYDVYVLNDSAVGVWPGDIAPDNLYAPGEVNCLGDTPGGGGNFAVQMPDEGDGNPCGIVTLYEPVVDENGSVTGYAANGYQLLDDVGFKVLKTKTKGKEFLTAVVLKGQEKAGPDSSWHESREMPLSSPVPLPTNSTTSLILHVHGTVAVERYDSHLDTGGKNALEVVGWISVGDLVYQPQ